MKKRALSLLLAFVMVLGLAAPVLAAEEPMAPEDPVPMEAAPADPVPEEAAAVDEPAAVAEPVQDEPAPADEGQPMPVDETYVLEVTVGNGRAQQFNSLAAGWEAAKAVGAGGTAYIRVAKDCRSDTILEWDKSATLYVYTDVPGGVTVTVCDNTTVTSQGKTTKDPGLQFHKGTVHLGEKSAGEYGAGELTITDNSYVGWGWEERAGISTSVDAGVKLIGTKVNLKEGLKICGTAELKSGRYTCLTPEGESSYLRCSGDVDVSALNLPLKGKVTLSGGYYGEIENFVRVNAPDHDSEMVYGLQRSLADGYCYAENYYLRIGSTEPMMLSNVWVMRKPDYTAPTVVNGWTFDGEEHPLFTGGSGACLEYALRKDENTRPGEEDAAWKTDVPKGKDAGEYYVWWRVKPDVDNNVAGIWGVDSTIRVAPAQAKVETAPTVIEGLKYTGEEHELVKPGTVVKEPPGCEMQYSLTNEEGSYTSTIPTGKKAGNYTVWYRAAGNEANKDNYTPSEPGSVQVTITTDALEILTPPEPRENLVWNGRSQQLLKSAGESNGGTVMYAQSLVDVEPADGSAWREDYTWVTGVSARTYYVWYKVKGFDGYADVPAVCIPVTIQVAVAESDGVYYTTLEEAIEKGNGTVNLLSSSELTKDVVIEKPVTLKNDRKGERDRQPAVLLGADQGCSDRETRDPEERYRILSRDREAHRCRDRLPDGGRENVPG